MKCTRCGFELKSLIYITKEITTITEKSKVTLGIKLDDIYTFMQKTTETETEESFCCPICGKAITPDRDKALTLLSVKDTEGYCELHKFYDPIKNTHKYRFVCFTNTNKPYFITQNLTLDQVEWHKNNMFHHTMIVEV